MRRAPADLVKMLYMGAEVEGSVPDVELASTSSLTKVAKSHVVNPARKFLPTVVQTLDRCLYLRELSCLACRYWVCKKHTDLSDQELLSGPCLYRFR